MNRKSITFLSIVLVMTITMVAFGSNGTQIGTVGARSTGMGGNFRGLADDWSAMYFNPAGLTQLEGKWTIGISTGLIMPRGSYTATAYPQNPFSGMDLNQVDATPQNFFVPAMGIFYKSSEKLTFGLGIYAPFGLGSEWDLVDLPASYGNTTGISKDKENFSDHQVINIQPTVALKISDKLSIGLGVSYIHGKMDLDMIKLAVNPYAAGYGDLFDKLEAADIHILPALTGDQMRLAIENILSGSGSAYGANFGLHFQATDKLSIGLSARYSTDLKLKGDNTQTIILHGDLQKINALNSLPDFVFASAQDPTGAATKAATLAALLPGFSGAISKTESKVTANLPLPITAGIGLAYKASEKLTLVSDISWTQWSSWDVIAVDVEGGDDLELKQDWKSTIEIGGGFECMVSPRFALRGGFYTVDSPIPDKTLTPTIPDPGRRYVITGGFGLNFGKTTFNLSGEYILFNDKTVDEYDWDMSTGAAENYAGKYLFNAIVITGGITINLN